MLDINSECWFTKGAGLSLGHVMAALRQFLSYFLCGHAKNAMQFCCYDSQKMHQLIKEDDPLFEETEFG